MTDVFAEMKNSRLLFSIVSASVFVSLIAVCIQALWWIAATLVTPVEPSAGLLTAASVGLLMGAAIRIAQLLQVEKSKRIWGISIAAAMLVMMSRLLFGMEGKLLLATLETVLISFLICCAGELTIGRFRIAQNQKEELASVLVRVIRFFGFLFFTTIVVFPFYYLIASSLKSRAELLSDPSNLMISLSSGMDRLFIAYTEVLIRFKFGRYILNSGFVSLLTVLMTLIPSILGAYAVTRLHFKGREFLSHSILLIYMFPAIVLVIPLYSVFSQIGLRDTLIGLVVVYPAMTIPVALYMLRSYFKTLPQDIEEAGLIDGCNRFEVILRITLPLSLPAIASVGLYVFMIAWNEFLFAFMFLDTPEFFTLSRGVISLNSQEIPRQYLMAGAVIITLPVMILFFRFERFLTGGLAAGGVKG